MTAAVPRAAAPSEARMATAVTKPLPARLPNRPLSRKPAKGKIGISQRVSSMLLTSCDARSPPRCTSTSVLVLHPIEVVVRACRIELPSSDVATSFLVPDLQFFVILVRHADGAADVVDDVDLGGRHAEIGRAHV